MPSWTIPAISLAILFLIHFGGGMMAWGRITERLKKLEDQSEGSQSVRDRTIRLEEKLDAMKTTFSETSERQTRTMENMARQLANIASKGLGFQGAAE